MTLVDVFEPSSFDLLVFLPKGRSLGTKSNSINIVSSRLKV